MSNNQTNRRPVKTQTSKKPPKPVETNEVESLEPQPLVDPINEENTIPVDQDDVATDVLADAPVLDDENWEELINQAKIDAADTSMFDAPTTVAATPEPTPSVDIEEEIQRRVQEELDKQKVTTTDTSGHREVVVPKTNPSIPEAKVELTEEEIAEQNAIATKNDTSTFVHIALGDTTDLEEAFIRESEEDSRPQSMQTEDPTPYAAGLALTNQLGIKNSQQQLLTNWLSSIMDKNTDAVKEMTKELRIARITPKIGDGNGPKKLSGATAKAAVISRLKGMFRVHLYNSGFWLDLRPAELLEVDGWIQEVDTDFRELGRMVGGHAHSIMDVFLKQKFFDILPAMVQRSNFAEWQNNDKLIDNISYHDYDTLLWAMCCMYYRDGIGVGVYCTNPDCRHIDDHQFVDLRKICFMNNEAFNSKAQEWMMRGARAGGPILTEADLKQYREQILGHSKTISLLNGTTSFKLEVPTIRRFVEESLTLVNKIQDILHGEHDVRNDLVSNQITYHLYRSLLPWINALEMNDDNGNLVYHIEDREAIYDALSIETYEDSDLYTKVTDYMRDTKCSIYASTTLKCSKCGKVADLQNDNRVTMDMQYLFFCLSCRQLEQTGASY